MKGGTGSLAWPLARSLAELDCLLCTACIAALTCWLALTPNCSYVRGKVCDQWLWMSLFWTLVHPAKKQEPLFPVQSTCAYQHRTTLVFDFKKPRSLHLHVIPTIYNPPTLIICLCALLLLTRCPSLKNNVFFFASLSLFLSFSFSLFLFLSLVFSPSQRGPPKLSDT